MALWVAKKDVVTTANRGVSRRRNNMQYRSPIVEGRGDYSLQMRLLMRAVKYEKVDEVKKIVAND